ncbi:MAG: sigma-54-dependent Fis family transcriptional regulator [Rhodothermaceae bacterium]|nr:sigma-54-dependent Fis family transcriptional regulator [Rhodothermaceae bacterium]
MSTAQPKSATHQDASLEALFQIALEINSIMDLDRLLKKVLEHAMVALHADRGFILLTNPKEAAGFEIRTAQNFLDSQLDDVLQFSTSAVRQVLQFNKSLLLYEAKTDERFKNAQSIVVQQIQSIACVPLSIKTRPIGAIYIDSVGKHGRFKQEHLGFLEAFANLAALAIENASLYQNLREENRRLRQEVQRVQGFTEIIGKSRSMERLFDILARVIDTDATVLLNGESGTGKELVARAIHHNGLRKDKPFMALFCGSLPDALLESELFGHKKGAFTGATIDKPGLFEAADGGTLFLDEVADLSPAMQTALLRVLQEGEVKRVGENKVRHVDVRIVSATNKSLKEAIKEGDFREDLYYRLNTITVNLPPLRERGDDVLLLAHHFLDKYAVGRRAYVKGISKDVRDRLKEYSWPGNIRELQNTIERAVVMATGEFIHVDDLDLDEEDAPRDDTYREKLARGQTLKEIEDQVLQAAIELYDGNISETARQLGVSRTWVHGRIKEWSDA